MVQQNECFPMKFLILLPHLTFTPLLSFSPQTIFTVMSSKDEIRNGPEFQRRITMLGPKEAIQVKHVEQILGSLNKVLTPEQLERLKKKQKSSEILPETYLNSTSHEKLAKYLDKHFSMLDDFKFTNINQNLTTKPALIVHPTKVEEIQQVVKNFV